MVLTVNVMLTLMQVSYASSRSYLDAWCELADERLVSSSQTSWHSGCCLPFRYDLATLQDRAKHLVQVLRRRLCRRRSVLLGALGTAHRLAASLQAVLRKQAEH